MNVNIKVKVKFFALHRELTGEKEIEYELPEGSNIGHLLKKLIEEYPRLRKLKSNTIVSLNHAYATPKQELKDGDEVALFPPVGGGL
jgi:molybdopterin synthase catalytic subunit